jgi:hypothetical protein
MSVLTGKGNADMVVKQSDLPDRPRVLKLKSRFLFYSEDHHFGTAHTDLGRGFKGCVSQVVTQQPTPRVVLQVHP